MEKIYICKLFFSHIKRKKSVLALFLIKKKMKIVSALYSCLLLLLFLFSLNHCTAPEVTTPVKTNEDSDNFSDTSPESAVLEEMRQDSLTFERNKIVLTKKLNELEGKLERFNIEFNNERKDLSLVRGGEIFQLNKKHLELKARLRESLTYTLTWSESHATLTEELETLEKAIGDLEKKIARS
jgi:hypothetical protein